VCRALVQSLFAVADQSAIALPTLRSGLLLGFLDRQVKLIRKGELLFVIVKSTRCAGRRARKECYA